MCVPTSIATVGQCKAAANLEMHGNTAHAGIVFKFKEGRNSVLLCSMVEPWEHWTKRNKQSGEEGMPLASSM